MESLRDQVQSVFRDVFGDDRILLQDTTTAAEIEGWDSLMHLNLVIAMEKRFGVKFSVGEIAGMNAPGENMGRVVQLLSHKMGGTNQ